MSDDHAKTGLRRCPPWCSGEHIGDEPGIFHHAEVGRIEGGELTVVVSLTEWASDDTPNPDPAVTLMWHPRDPEDKSVCLQDGIEFDLTESEALIPLLRKANEALRAGRRP